MGTKSRATRTTAEILADQERQAEAERAQRLLQKPEGDGWADAARGNGDKARSAGLRLKFKDGKYTCEGEEIAAGTRMAALSCIRWGAMGGPATCRASGAQAGWVAAGTVRARPH